MSKLRKQHTKEEQLKIVKLSLEEGQRVRDLAVRFDVNENMIYNWRSAYVKNREDAFPESVLLSAGITREDVEAKYDRFQNFIQQPGALNSTLNSCD